MWLISPHKKFASGLKVNKVNTGLKRNSYLLNFEILSI